MGKLASQSARPGDHGWDIAFTRMSLQVAPLVEACVQGLMLRFQAIGLRCDLQSRHTPRGLSTFLAAVGPRGLLFIVDITMIDGMAVAERRGAALDVRLLDACGDTVAHCAVAAATEAQAYGDCAEEVIAAAGLARVATAVFVMAIAHFDLVPTT
jgi:hypothetical protein